MKSSKMKVNKKLLYIKGHFFFFNAGTAPLVPYLSTYARQLGFSSATVGLIYTVLPLFGLIAKPLFGIIADRFRIQKSLFITFQVVTIISFSAIYFIPSNPETVSVELECGANSTLLRSCYNSGDLIDKCKVSLLEGQNATSSCDMNCDMTSPDMWQMACLHWHIPEYCYSNTDRLEYSAHIGGLQLNDSCANLAATNVTLNGYTYKAGCRIGNGHVDVNEPCTLNCTNAELSAALSHDQANMTCVDRNLNYRFCSNEPTALEALAKETWLGDDCLVSCDLERWAPWRLVEVCEGWGADVVASCLRTAHDRAFPANLSFTGLVHLQSTIAEHDCVSVELNQIVLPDGSMRHPLCKTDAEYMMKSELFQTSCEISCDNALLNEMFSDAAESQKESSTQFTRQFWLFFMLMIFSWIGQAVVVTFADAICLNLLGDKVSLYGKQRLWGSVGFGVFSLATGLLIDLFSDGAYKNYTVAFVLMFVFMSADVAVSSLLKVESTKMSLNILSDVGSLVSSLPTFAFLVWTVAVGMCTGMVWHFLFWLVEDVARKDCSDDDYTKTLQGLVSAIQTFGGEIPFLFLSGYILRKVGHAHMMSVVLFAFGVRFLLYSTLSNPWLVLPIEILQGVTFGMFYPTMAIYASEVAPAGTETTVQGLVGAVFEGVGTSLGALIGGRLYETHGGWRTFQWFGYGALVCGVLNVLVQYLIRDRTARAAPGYSEVIRYEQPHDIVYMLDAHPKICTE